MDTQQIQNLVDAVVSSLFVELEASGNPGSILPGNG